MTAPAGEEADDPNSVPVSPRLAANEAGDSPAHYSCGAAGRARLAGGRPGKIGPDAEGTQKNRRTGTHASTRTEQRKPNHDPEG